MIVSVLWICHCDPLLAFRLSVAMVTHKCPLSLPDAEMFTAECDAVLL